MSAGSTERWPAKLGFVAALTLVSLLAYWPGMDGEMVSDDHNAIVNNEFVSGKLLTIFTKPSWWGSARGDAPGYRPVTTLTFALNHRVGGISPRGYHVTNLFVHVLVCCLVMAVGGALGMSGRASASAAAVFALMPVHSEAVLWVVGRAELLAAAGLLAGLLAILRYRQGGPAWLLGAAALALAAGILAKENAMALLIAPPLLATVLPNGQGRRRRDLWAFVALLAGFAAAWWLRAEVAGHLLGASGGDELDNPLAGLPLDGRLAGALSVLGRYLWLIVWPHPLSADYSYNALAIGPGFIADRYSAAGLAGLATVVAVVCRARRMPVPAFCVLMAGACYAIVSNVLVPIGTIMGERLFYLPSAGLSLAVAPALARALGTRPRKAGLAAALVATAWLAVNIDRSRDWTDPVRLFSSAVTAQPRAARARMELGSAYGHAGMAAKALVEFDQALDIYPGYMSAWYNRANLLAREGRYEDAALSYLRAIEIVGNFEPAWFNLGLTRHLQGRETDAAKALGRATQLRQAAKVATRSTGR
ncbi:MAG: tetratricopeptide repeat protein [Deltaproteobacteria bacterium]